METKKPLSYRNLGIWQQAHDLAVVVHKMTLEKLPNDILGKTTNNFLQSVIAGHLAPKDTNSKVEPSDEE